MRILATYDKITPESAEEGDYSESGWLLPYGVELPMPDGLYGEEAAAWIADNVEPVWSWDPTDYVDDDEETAEDQAAISAARFLRDEGAAEPSEYGYGVDGSTVTSYYQADGSTDYSTGEETRNAYHLEGFTHDQLRAIYRRVTR